MGQPLTPETLVYGLVQASDPQISPDGTRIIYTRTAVEKAAQERLTLRPADASTGTRGK